MTDTTGKATNKKLLFRAGLPITNKQVLVNKDGDALDSCPAIDDQRVVFRSEQDSDLNTKLGLRPDMRSFIFPKEEDEKKTNKKEGFVVFINTDRRVVFTGDIICDLLPLLRTGEYNADQIERELQGKHDGIPIRTALHRLSSSGVLISNDHPLDERQAFYWSSMNISPALAAERLQTCPVHLSSLIADQPFPSAFRPRMEQLGGWHFVENPDDAALLIYFTSSFMQKEICEINKRCLKDKKKWMLIQLHDPVALFSPIFDPASSQKNNPCWQCLHSRLQGGYATLTERLHEITPDRTPQFNDVFDHQAVLIHLQAELGAWLAEWNNMPLRSHLVSVAIPHASPDYHWVQQLPQCTVCGDRELCNPNRTPHPPRLQAQQTPQFNSGGRRKVSARSTIAKHRRHLSPITGIIPFMKGMHSVSSHADGGKMDWLFTTYLDSTHQLSGHLNNLRGTMMNAGGKGATAIQAEASGLCEFLERHSGIYRGGEEIKHRSRYVDFKEGMAIHPNKITLFSDDQIEHGKIANTRNRHLRHAPPPFNPEASLDWTPVWSLTDECFKHVMTAQCYYVMDRRKDVVAGNPPYATANSNGCAAGSCMEDAVLQGFYELIERDAASIWWFNRLAMPAVDLHSFKDPWLDDAEKFYHDRLGRNLWMLDITHDFGVPVFVALSQALGGEGTPRLIFGAGANLDPKIAALRAVSEVNQTVLPAVTAKSITNDFQKQIGAWFNKKPADRDDSWAYLLPRTDVSPRTSNDYPLRETCEEVLTEINFLRRKAEQKGMEMLLLDQTRPDIGLPVVMVLVPGTRHFWPRLAPGRLYDVPVEMGLLPRANTENELNPYSTFFC